jgi:hypothetical protein
MAVAAAACQRRAADLLIKLSCHKPKWLLSGWKFQELSVADASPVFPAAS